MLRRLAAIVHADLAGSSRVKEQAVSDAFAILRV